MTDDLTISRSSSLLEADVSGELIALDVDSGTCFGFNPTATRIWALLDRPRRLSELCDLLTAQYAVDRETCERDVLALARDLERDGLVEIGGTGSAG